MRRVMIGMFPSATAAILAAAMAGGMDGGTMLDLVPTYRDAEGAARLAEAERLTTELLGPEPSRPSLSQFNAEQVNARQGAGSQADPARSGRSGLCPHSARHGHCRLALSALADAGCGGVCPEPRRHLGEAQHRQRGAAALHRAASAESGDLRPCPRRGRPCPLWSNGRV